jgi:hypothetical protein
MITVEQAREMGAKGGPVDHNERELFEAWMQGHCWHCGDWIATDEDDGYYDLASTRVIWAAWCDRAALQSTFTEGVHKGTDGHRYVVARVSEQGEDEFA